MPLLLCLFLLLKHCFISCLTTLDKVSQSAHCAATKLIVSDDVTRVFVFQDGEATSCDSGCSVDGDSDDSDGPCSLLQDCDESQCASPGLSQPFRRLKTTDDRRAGRRTATTKPYQTAKTPTQVTPRHHLPQETKQQQQPEQNCTVSKSDRATQIYRNLITFITTVVSVEKFQDFECVADAEKLAKVTIAMTKSHQLHSFLKLFGHSVSCMSDQCNNTCRMFRRIRGHVANARHPCAVMQVYSQVLRLHIDTCLEQNCGLVSCKSMLAMRSKSGNEVLPRNFQQMEQLIHDKMKQNAEVTSTPKETAAKPEKEEDSFVIVKQEDVEDESNSDDSLVSMEEQQTMIPKQEIGALNLSTKEEQTSLPRTSAMDKTKKEYSATMQCSAVSVFG